MGVIISSRHETELVSARIHTIISNLPGMVYQHLNNSPEYTITFIGEGSEELTGYKAEELVGGKNKFMEMVHPDDLEDIAKRTAETLDVGLPCELTYRIIMHDGSIKWIRDRMIVSETYTDSTLNVIDGYMFDITHQRQLEATELSELMLDTSPLCVQLWDRNYNTIGCNEAAVALYGYKNKQEYIDRFLKECSPEYQPDGQRSADKAVMLVDRAFKEGKCVFDWMHRTTDGTPMPSEITLVRVNYKNDFLVVGYTRDLREILRLEVEAEKIYYDPLLGIHNRRFLDENLDRVLKSLSRSKSYLSLMMIDIDFFKMYNDTYGHGAGDVCLKIITEALSENITRADDFVARYGGEEFAIVLPNTDERGARLIAEKLLQCIRDRGIPHEQSDAANCVTISIGVTTGRPEYTQSAEDYVKRADEMLYRSKQDGRNRYTFGEI
ncbi:MAG: diguanylate cyclase [Oscillospiraceae bacterium]|nr:diguanylate cyclase [Oscillospiraceae bacterium]